jgi:trimeric autotransporter adhesin
MLINHQRHGSGFCTDSSPQAGCLRITLTSRIRAGRRQPTRTKAAIVLAAFTTLAVLSAPCKVSSSPANTAPIVSLSAVRLSFGHVPVGTTRVAQAVTLKNTGNEALSIVSFAIAGTCASIFAQSHNCGSSVAAGAKCTISVTFTPTASGTRTAAVSISDNASGSPQAVALSGTGVAAGGVTLSPTSLSFRSQRVDTTSAAQTITLSNGSSASLSITAVTITGTNPGDFAEVADTCGSSLATGATCMIGIAFTPSTPGQRTATLSVTDTASGGPQTASLTGTGISDVILSWSASTSSGIVGYNVYRGTTSGGEGSTPLNSTPITGTTYVDANVTPGRTYYHFLKSVASDGELSAPSSETEATVPAS